MAGPAFPLIIIALVPFRLLVMPKWWDREVLRYVDGWACREGTPEGDEDRRRAGVGEEGEVDSGELEAGNVGWEEDGSERRVENGEGEILRLSQDRGRSSGVEVGDAEKR